LADGLLEARAQAEAAFVTPGEWDFKGASLPGSAQGRALCHPSALIQMRKGSAANIADVLSRRHAGNQK